MKYFVPLLLAGLLASGAAAAQTAPDSAAVRPCAAYSGQVAGNQKPLAGVSVAVKGTKVILITNQDGFFTLPPKMMELPTLLVSAAGYAPQEVRFTSCAPVTVELQLLPGTRIKKRGKRKGFIMHQGY